MLVSLSCLSWGHLLRALYHRAAAAGSLRVGGGEGREGEGGEGGGESGGMGGEGCERWESQPF